MTNLEGADLYKADLRGVRLYSSLKNACLIDANLEGADLELAIYEVTQYKGYLYEIQPSISPYR
jgi:uncharacterized protein YjbI with pentapeptide repeats